MLGSPELTLGFFGGGGPSVTATRGMLLALGTGMLAYFGLSCWPLLALLVCC